MKYLIFIPIMFLMVSCGSTHKVTIKDLAQLKKTEQKVQVINQKLDDKAKVYVAAAKKIVQSMPKTNETSALVSLLDSSQEIIGVPEGSLTNDVLLLSQLPDSVKAKKKYDKMVQEQQALIDARIKLEDKAQEIQTKINEEIPTLTTTKSWWDRLKEQTMDYLTYAVVIIILAITTPILVSWINEKVRKR